MNTCNLNHVEGISECVLPPVQLILSLGYAIYFAISKTTIPMDTIFYRLIILQMFFAVLLVLELIIQFISIQFFTESNRLVVTLFFLCSLITWSVISGILNAMRRFSPRSHLLFHVVLTAAFLEENIAFFDMHNRLETFSSDADIAEYVFMIIRWICTGILFLLRCLMALYLCLLKTTTQKETIKELKLVVQNDDDIMNSDKRKLETNEHNDTRDSQGEKYEDTNNPSSASGVEENKEEHDAKELQIIIPADIHSDATRAFQKALADKLDKINIKAIQLSTADSLSGYAVVICHFHSRLEDDADAAVKIIPPDQYGHTLFVVMHSVGELNRNKTPQSKDHLRISKKGDVFEKFYDVIDILFAKEEGIFTCDLNANALKLMKDIAEISHKETGSVVQNVDTYLDTHAKLHESDSAFESL